MLKKSASIVLTSFRGSTYRSVRLASSLAAVLPDSLFEHPGVMLGVSAVWAIPWPIKARDFGFVVERLAVGALRIRQN